MTIGDVQRGQIEVVDGDGPQGSRSYMTIAVSRHKTAKTWGLQWSVCRRTFTAKYLSTVRRAFQLTDTSPVFLTDRGEAIASASVVNRCVQRCWKRSGVSASLPQRFTATANRRLITTEARNVDPGLAPLVAAQLCHSQAMANKTYAMTRRRQFSSTAVHLVDKAQVPSLRVSMFSWYRYGGPIRDRAEERVRA